MNSLCKEVLPRYSQLPDLDLGSNTGASIVTQELSNSIEMPICYSFRSFWIELTSMSCEKYDSRTDSKNIVWRALVHYGTGSKTVIALGSYTSRLEAAVKTEQIISKWQ